MKYIIFIIVLICLTQASFAQNRKAKKAVQPKKQTTKSAEENNSSDTALPPRTVVVTSEFAPSLKQTSKVNFNAAVPLPDSTRPKLDYNIPVQNLSFAYQSPALKAMAENIDSNVHWNNTSFLKVGFGNYSTPYLQAGLAFGDGVTSVVNVNAKYISSKGSLPFQNYSKTNAEAIVIFTTRDNKNEWNVDAYLSNSTQYFYGYQPDSLKFSKSDLLQTFTGFGGKVGLRNKVVNSYGISYNPSASIDVFTDNNSAIENTFAFDLPVSKSITKTIDFNVGFNGSITSYKTDSVNINNSVFYVNPSLTFKSSNVKLTAGFTPSWDNKNFHMLPNFTLDAKLNEEKFVLQAGFIGYYNKTTYHSLTDYNPWIAQPTELNNARLNEIYGGFKGSAGDHFTYNARLSFLKIKNQPLFVNDTITGRTFNVVYEPSLNDVRVHGEIGYTQSEQFSLLAGVSFNQYSNFHVNEKAYGLPPVEFNGAVRYQVLKDLLLKADVYSWRSVPYQTKDLQTKRLDAAFDANAGAEFSFLPNWKAWLQFNNVFNNKYQRWNQYEALGFNMLVGVVYSFGDLKTK